MPEKYSCGHFFCNKMSMCAKIQAPAKLEKSLA